MLLQCFFQKFVTVQPYTKYTKNLRFQTSLNSDFVTMCMAELLRKFKNKQYITLDNRYMLLYTVCIEEEEICISLLIILP